MIAYWCGRRMYTSPPTLGGSASLRSAVMSGTSSAAQHGPRAQRRRGSPDRTVLIAQDCRAENLRTTP
jgi:hypothetical protein